MTLSISRRTEIIQEVVDRRLTTILDVADSIFPDDGLPGDVTLKGKQADEALLAMVTVWSDWAKVLDPDYEMVFRAGLDTPPESPALLQLLSIPGEFTKLARRIRQVAQKDEGNEVRQSARLPEALPPGGGIPGQGQLEMGQAPPYG